ncbi:hypothetical protein UAJ10_25625 [Nitrospirillum sp. BR 11164]|uniref:hypothetical protein n=1 Tax=Nitrospirillum sp. BR 11164 TaxID=3104324 RepID=UPI002AFF52BC|nr:hypothetical protein [Nitrospirillum sp. BR 11164]MEA1652376.1 hypothetical protein [Nitrospirillum sp. BR 11164]
MRAASHPGRAAPFFGPLFSAAVFIGALLLAGGVAEMALTGGFMGGATLAGWRDAILSAGDGPYFRHHFATSYPLLPYYLNLVAAWIPGMDTLPIPLAVDTLCLAALAVTLVRGFTQAGYGAGAALAAGLLLALHPYALAEAGQGNGIAPALLAMVWFSRAAIAMRVEGGVDAMAVAGGSLVLLFLADPAGAFVLIGMLPFLAGLLPPALIVSSAVGGFLVLLFPVALSLAALAYLNWLFHGHALAFLAQLPDVAVGGTPWLLGPGGTPLGALGMGLGTALASAPLILASLAALRRAGLLVTAVLLPAVGVFCALVLASLTDRAPYPGTVLAFLVPVAAVGAAATGPRRLRPLYLCLLALAGWAGGAAVMALYPTPDTLAWRAALARPAGAPPAPTAEQAVGLFLRGVDDVALDPAGTAAIIDARGRADGLVLPTSDRLKATLLMRRLDAGYVVLPDPEGAPAARQDMFNQAFPTFYAEGRDGYRLAFDRAGWRVYQRVSAAPAASDGPAPRERAP